MAEDLVSWVKTQDSGYKVVDLNAGEYKETGEYCRDQENQERRVPAKRKKLGLDDNALDLSDLLDRARKEALGHQGPVQADGQQNVEKPCPVLYSGASVRGSSSLFGEKEPLVSSGVGATMLLLRQKGIVVGPTKQNKEYRPRFRLEHCDEFGRLLSSKEAFKQLSHQFHGKKPGKLKMEKKLAKIESEQRLKAMTFTDTPLQSASSLSRVQKETGLPYVALSRKPVPKLEHRPVETLETPRPRIFGMEF